jgi:hypothetical protein
LASELPCIAADDFLSTPGDGGFSASVLASEAGRAEASAKGSCVEPPAGQDGGQLCCGTGQDSLLRCRGELGDGGLGGQTLLELASAWPELAALRQAASSPNVNRLRCALTTFASHTRVEFAAALLAARKAARDSRLLADSELPEVHLGNGGMRRLSTFFMRVRLHF